MKLAQNEFMALSTIIWATGEVDPAAAAALLESARTCGLAGEDLAEIEGSTRQRINLESIGPLVLDHADKLFVYGLATWLARADHMLIDPEKRALAQLGDRLGLSSNERNVAAAAAHAIRDAPDGRGEHDVLALARELARTRA